MNIKVLIAGFAAAALTISGAASADYQGKSGKGQDKSHGQSNKIEVKSHSKSEGKRKSAAAHARKVERSNSQRVRGVAATRTDQVRSCPRGLAKRNNGCVAPGLARKNLARGDKLFGALGTNNVPASYAAEYRDTATSLYRYAAGNVYKIDPTTRRVAEVIKAPTR